MADRTRSTDRAVINVSPATRDKLNEVLAALEAQEGRTATQEQLIRALLEGVPLWQADLMLRAYTRQSASSHDADTVSE